MSMLKLRVVYLWTVAIVVIALQCKHAAAANEAADPTFAAAETQSTQNLARLYTVIRNVALPPTSAEETGTEPVTQRFLMLLPGKVLNYYDYFPGNTYESALENPDYDGRQVVIPPRVIENMFSLTDIIPGRYPLRGAETGESMAVIYNDILNKLEVKGFTQKSQMEKERYLLAIDYLAEEIPDPLNVEENVTRFQLYRRSQDLYNDKRLQMEDTIAEKRQTLPAIEFELWFQRNYPTLNSQVEGAYTEWLIFGEKAIVELYKSYLDVEGPGIDLEKARMALRASGYTSLDRARTIFPVSFVPSNWYRYLVNVTAVDLAREEKDDLSRDELQSKIGELEAKKRVLQALTVAEPSASLREKLAQLKASLNSSNGELTDYSTKTEELRQSCLSSRIAAKASGSARQISEITPECQKYEEATLNATTNMLSNSELYLCVSDLDFQINDIEATREAIRNAVAELEEEIRDLNTKLATAGIKLTQLAKHAAHSQDQLDSQWLQFEFDSAQESKSSRSSSKHFNTAASFKASGGFWSVKGSFSYSRSESSFQSEMNSAQVGVRGELLRVTIQRPWFRPSLFKSKQFQIRVDEKANVSPGPESDEIKFINKVVHNNYLLPEYVTSFLLARNVELEYKGITADVAAHAVSVSHRASISGGWGPFRASYSYGYGRRERTFNTEATSNGLRISIPGAQIIGYFTQVTPKFPL